MFGVFLDKAKGINHLITCYQGCWVCVAAFRGAPFRSLLRTVNDGKRQAEFRIRSLIHPTLKTKDASLMMSCALRFSLLAVALMMFGASSLPASAEIGSARVHGPQTGVALLSELSPDERAAANGELIAALSNGASAFRDADFGAAVDWYELAERLAPEDGSLKSRIRAMVRVSSDKRFLQAETRKLLPTAKGELTDRYKATYAQARRLYRDGDFENAYKLFHDLWLVGGDYRGTLGYLDKARERGNLETVSLAQIDPESSRFLNRTAGVPDPGAGALSPSTAEMADAFAEADAASVDELILQAQFEAQAGNVAEARALYEKALSRDPDNRVVRHNLAQLKEVAPRPTEAAALTVASVPPPPPGLSPLNEVGDALARAQSALASGAHDRAEAAYREVLRLQPENAEAREGLANVESARAGLAREELNRTLEIALTRGENLLEQGRVDQARTSFETAMTLDPGNARALAGLQRIQAGVEPAAPRALGNPQAEDPRISRGDREIAQDSEVPAERPSDDILNIVTDPEMAPEPVAPSAPEPPVREVHDVSHAVTADASAAPAGAADDSDRGWFRSLFSRGDTADSGAREVAQADPVAPASGPAPSAAPTSSSAQVNSLLNDARYQYEIERNLEGARQKWQWVLDIEPGNKVAQTYLAETEAEYRQYLATRQQQEQAAERKRAQDALLRSPLTIQTDRPTALSEFMRLISFSTTEEIEYYIADGADTPVFVNFVDRSLADVLDAVLLPVGLAWSINQDNLITIETDLKHNAFRLTEAQVNQVRSLLQAGRMQTAIWGQPEPPSKGIELTLDERQRVLLAVGSRLHIQKIQDLLASLDTAERPTLDTAFYKIREQDGPKIKSLINALVTADTGSPFEMDRRIFLDGQDLIIRDTPENLTKIEELLIDQNFIQKMRDEGLEITNFNLAPRDFETTPRDVIDTFTSRVVIAIKTLLYSRTGEEAAAAEGRKLFFDNATYQLTIIDTPSNLARVGNYLNSLPELRRRRQQQVVFLEHAIAEALASDLVSILGLRGALVGVEGGETVVRRLRRGEEFTFRDLRIRVVRIDENDPNDRLDDSVELNIITGTQSSNINLRELDTTFFESYEITAEDIQPSGSTTAPGEGVARILIRYVGTPAEREALAQQDIQQEQEISEEEGISLFPFGPLNALIIRYDNPAVLQDVLELIAQLDMPTPQVEVETRFVQVNEQRAREFSATFGLENLVSGQNLNTDFFNFNAGFARATDEIRDLGDIPLENPWAANLLNGSTTLEFILGTGVPGLSFQLRMLEAEGVLNIVNGPKVTMLDNEQGEFRIETGSPYPQNTPLANAGQLFIGPGPRNLDINTPQISNQFQQAATTRLSNEDGTIMTNRVSAVVLLVTPQVTSEKSIIFDITAEILDLDNFIGNQIFSSNDPFSQQIPAVSNDLRGAAISEQEKIIQNHLKMLEAFQQTGADPESAESQAFLAQMNALLGTSLGGLAEIVNAANPFDFQTRSRANNLGTVQQLGLFTPGQVMRTRKMIITRARTSDGGTIVLGGWTGERTIESTSGVPVLRNMPYIGKMFFSRNARNSDRTTLLIFLTAHLID
jgi:type II secretory pathway component GspD/PulD (secretin)/tetratricopeptide (TPR) repeat protein